MVRFEDVRMELGIIIAYLLGLQLTRPIHSSWLTEFSGNYEARETVICITTKIQGNILSVELVYIRHLTLSCGSELCAPPRLKHWRSLLYGMLNKELKLLGSAQAQFLTLLSISSYNI